MNPSSKHFYVICGVAACIVLSSTLISFAQVSHVQTQTAKMVNSQTQLTQTQSVFEQASNEHKVVQNSFKTLKSQEQNIDQFTQDLLKQFETEKKELVKKKENLTIQVVDYERDLQKKRDRVILAKKTNRRVDNHQIKNIFNNFRNHKRRAEELAEKAGVKVINRQYMGGTNKRIRMTDYTYYPEDDSYRIEMSLNWNGAILGMGDFAADGYIKVNNNGSNLTWHPTYLNSHLRKTQEDTKMAALIIGGAIVLGSLDQ